MMGEVLFALFMGLATMTVAAFVVLLAAVMVESTAELLGVDWLDVCAAVVVVMMLIFLGWFAVGMPWPGFDGQPVPHAVEGREEWIDLREGTHYSQGERRTDD